MFVYDSFIVDFKIAAVEIALVFLGAVSPLTNILRLTFGLCLHSIHLNYFQVLRERVIQRFRENEEYLMQLEKLINPLLDDDDANSLSYIFS